MFAEDYDDPTSHRPLEPSYVEKHEIISDNFPRVHETINCPNKWNPHHRCVRYCRRKWGLKTFSPIQTLEDKRKVMLQKYPLPAGWEEIGDPKT